MGAPKHIWQTLVGRAVFGFDSEITANPSRFLNEQYLLGLINQENSVLKTNSKLFFTLLVQDAVALMFMQGIKLNISFLGQNLDKIPASTQILCLFIGLSLFGFCVNSLEVILFSRLRGVLVFKAWGTDLPNIATAHLKGSGIWSDLISPRFIGYSSGLSHKIISIFFLIIVFSFYVAILIASSATLGALYKFGRNSHPFLFDLPTLISTSGLVMGYFGVLLFLVAILIPFKYTS